MIHPTPVQTQDVELDHWPPIRKEYLNYETTFVILHPFLKLKEGETDDIDFKKRHKKNIIKKTTPVSWIDIIQKAQLKDIKELDRLLAYLHAANYKADRAAWIKFRTYIDSTGIIDATIDDYPDLLTDITLQSLIELGYEEVFLFSDTEENQKKYLIQSLIESPKSIPLSHQRILTPDNKIIIATDFDQRFSYLSSSKILVAELINKINPEGFYCNETTKSHWSDEPSANDLIDWSSPERYEKYNT